MLLSFHLEAEYKSLHTFIYIDGVMLRKQTWCDFECSIKHSCYCILQLVHYAVTGKKNDFIKIFLFSFFPRSLISKNQMPFAACLMCRILKGF